jgi:hypothetical protein
MLCFSPSLGRKIIYKNIYSRRNSLPLPHSAMIHVPGIGWTRAGTFSQHPLQRIVQSHRRDMGRLNTQTV